MNKLYTLDETDHHLIVRVGTNIIYKIEKSTTNALNIRNAFLAQKFK